MPTQRRRDTSETPQTPRGNTTRKRIITTILITCIAVTLAAGTGIFAIKTFLSAAQSSTQVQLDTHVSEHHTQDSPNQKHTDPSTPEDGAVDYLLVGADSRVDMQGNPLTEQQQQTLRSGDVDTTNTDVIMVMRVTDTTANVISIPRDTYVTDRAHGNMKINGVYGSYQRDYKDTHPGDTPETEREAADAGRRGLAEVVGSLTGVTIDHYVEIGLFGFATFTDAVGGVEVCLNQATEDPMTGASFPAGVQTLNGPDALAFVRQRYGLANGDLDRIKRQQAYLSSMASTITSAGTLTDPRKLRNLLNATKETIAVDQNLNLTDTAKTLSKLDLKNITFDTIPVLTINGTGDHGESVVKVDTQQVQNFFTAAATTNTPPPTNNGSIPLDDFTPDTTNLPEDIAAVTPATPARVFTTTQDTTPAKAAAKTLADDGIVVTDIAPAPEQWTGHGAQVLTNSPSASAQRVGNLLDLPVVTERTLPPGMIIVLVGKPVSHTAPTDTGAIEAQTAPPPQPQVGKTAASEGAVCVN